MALVTVIAVVLPWVLEREPRPSEEEIAIQIPSPDSPPSFESQKPAAKDPAPKAEAPSPPDEASRDDALRAEQERVLAPPAKPQAKEKPAATAAEVRKKPVESADTAEPKQFVVQIAALADADKARDIQQELATKGLKAYTERIKSAGGDVTRVRVGPFPSREAAETERTRLKALGFEGNVAPR